MLNIKKKVVHVDKSVFRNLLNVRLRQEELKQASKDTQNATSSGQEIDIHIPTPHGDLKAIRSYGKVLLPISAFPLHLQVMVYVLLYVLQ